jgi:membrane protein YdbS with pleckstrin-like domain
MIGLLVAILGPLLKVRPTPPHVPAGSRDVLVFRASPRYLGYRYLQVLVQVLPAMAAPIIGSIALTAAAAQGKPAPTFVLVLLALLALGALVGAAFALVCARLDFEFHCYVMTDRCLRIRRGIWEQLEATLTYANVQNVRVVQGPLERLFSIASVVVDTAGGAGKSERQDPLLQHHRGVIRGIEDANALRDRIMQRMKQSRSAGLGDRDDHPDHSEPETELTLLQAVRDEARGLAADLRQRAARTV